jgi:hypothetical protein
LPSFINARGFVQKKQISPRMHTDNTDLQT